MLTIFHSLFANHLPHKFISWFNFSSVSVNETFYLFNRNCWNFSCKVISCAPSQKYIHISGPEYQIENRDMRWDRASVREINEKWKNEGEKNSVLFCHLHIFYPYLQRVDVENSPIHIHTKLRVYGIKLLVDGKAWWESKVLKIPLLLKLFTITLSLHLYFFHSSSLDFFMSCMKVWLVMRKEGGKLLATEISKWNNFFRSKTQKNSKSHITHATSNQLKSH